MQRELTDSRLAGRVKETITLRRDGVLKKISKIGFNGFLNPIRTKELLNKRQRKISPKVRNWKIE